MSTCGDMSNRRREAHTLYLKLRYLGLEAHAQRDPRGLEGYKVVVDGLKSLNPTHADRLMRLVMDHEASLIEILPRRESPDLRIIRQEGIDP